MACLDDNAVLDYVDGGTTVPVAVERHLATCPACRAVVAALARGAATAERGERGDEPARVGRFEIEDVIGRGGMGVVYRAWDPELGRRVAVKRVRRAGGGTHGEELRARLVREARALAQLAHPNIVAIHDVGEHDGDVYIAMEYVAGANLREWLAAAPRPRAAIEAVLIAAGRGLQVAHAAGLVHRDVKPDNVLVGEDGRVRVVDFGLVAMSGEGLALGSGMGTGTGTGTGDETALTRDGTAVGTPAFMAPEQKSGVAEAPGDQWSFAVTACVALAGARPEAKGDRVVLPDRLDARVRRVLARALAIAPAARFPSMGLLIDALEAAFAPPRWRRWALAGGGAAAIAAVIAALALGGRGGEVEACAPARVGLRGVWDGEVATAIARTVAASGHPRAADAGDRIAAALAREAASWQDLRRGLCRDDAGGRGPAPERAARGRCLERGRVRLRALTTALQRPLDRDAVDGAVVAAASLGALLPCADGGALVAAEPGAPASPIVAAALDERLAAIEADLALGRYPAAITAGEALAHDAGLAGDLGRQARALQRVAAARTADGDLPGGVASARAAIKVAARAGDDAILADGWIALVSTLAELAQYDEAGALVAVAEAAVARAGDDRRQALHLLDARVTLAMWTKAYDAVLPAMDAALPVAVTELGAGDPDVIHASLTHAEALLDVARVTEARRWASAALADATATFGEGHPRVYPAHKVVGLVLLAVREPALAREHLAALAAWADTRGPRHPDRYYGHTALSWALADLGELDQAVAELGLARRAAIDAGGLDDLRVSVTQASIGDYAWATGDLAGAEAAWTEALAIRRKKHEPGNLTIGRAASGLGGVLAARGALTRARPLLEEAVAILAKPGDSPDLALARARLAHVLWQQGERPRAHRLVALMRPQAEGEQAALPPDVIPLQRWVKQRCPDVACSKPR